MLQTKPDVRVQRLDDVDDFDLLVSGDVVLTGHLGPLVDGPMLVSRESRDDFRVLIQRYTPDSIYRAVLKKPDVNVVDGQLKFDYRKGERISVMSDIDWAFYEGYCEELEQARLE